MYSRDISGQRKDKKKILNVCGMVPDISFGRPYNLKAIAEGIQGWQICWAGLNAQKNDKDVRVDKKPPPWSIGTSSDGLYLLGRMSRD